MSILIEYEHFIFHFAVTFSPVVDLLFEVRVDKTLLK